MGILIGVLLILLNVRTLVLTFVTPVLDKAWPVW
jgi:hypothetical protein